MPKLVNTDSGQCIRGLWTDIGTYINYIVDSNLNSHLEGEDEETKEWEMSLISGNKGI